ncbi:adenylate kinase [Trichonephila clavipes]|nr:adenylate kinase [Trichonephila clavipes]
MNDPEIHETLRKGLFVSDECITRLVLDRIKESSHILLLDGYPRTLSQASNFGIEYVSLVIVLKADDETCIKRIQGRKDKREDDKDIDVVRKRIQIYHKITEPVINYYKEKGLVEYVEAGDEAEKDSVRAESDELSKLFSKTAESFGIKTKVGG